jgi:hypothetical protein
MYVDKKETNRWRGSEGRKEKDVKGKARNEETQ